MKVLIIDDSPLTRTILRDTLSEDGFEVFEAGSFTEATFLFHRIHPELIIKDLFMPDWDAIDSIHYFRDMDAEVKILLCSTESSKYEMLAGLRAGAHDFLVKPLERTRVLHVVRRCLS